MVAFCCNPEQGVEQTDVLPMSLYAMITWCHYNYHVMRNQLWYFSEQDHTSRFGSRFVCNFIHNPHSLHGIIRTLAELKTYHKSVFKLYKLFCTYIKKWWNYYLLEIVLPLCFMNGWMNPFWQRRYDLIIQILWRYVLILSEKIWLYQITILHI